MRTAPIYAVVIGILPVIGVTLVLGQEEGLVIGLVVGLILGAAIYQWCFDSGLRMVLDAQRTLVAVDTEQNTRKVAALLEENRDGLKERSQTTQQ
ncbi:MAG: hypothetical protein A3F68_11145 [Acidobacteria bacterium RIFCSPLOWO2_12_FULL_54_10]|nr:MAG: hypothetical protein A3F68_11145 [Acidobacteria bacterium RIFCSPLOWO2_12_FULL_54_10]